MSPLGPRHPLFPGARPALRLLPLVVLVAGLLTPPTASASRLKDIAFVDGVRPNQLLGYGLVVGLDGTGDTQRVGFTRQSLTAMLSRAGVRFDPDKLILRNVAAVMVTATLPPLARPGARIDLTVNSVGNARSLAGGTLLMTSLAGADGNIYAVGQGPLQVGGYSIGGRTGSRLQRNHLNVGIVAEGGLVERTVPVALARDGKLLLRLLHPDFTTAQRVAAGINQRAGDFGAADGFAQVVDAGTVALDVSGRKAETLPDLIAKLEGVEVTPDTTARVVINGRTGTIIMGGQVRLDPVAVAHGGLTLEVRERPFASQPQPGAAGATAVVPASGVQAREERGKLQVVAGAATLAEIVTALNGLGVKPRDLVQILQAVHAAGALHARLEVL